MRVGGEEDERSLGEGWRVSGWRRSRINRGGVGGAAGEHPSFALAVSEPGAENLMMEASNKKGVWGKWTALSL